jgi:hypothetical protein
MSKENNNRSWIDTSWDRFLVEGGVLFKYMTKNYQDMFDGDIIKHFSIRNEGCVDIGSDELIKEHGPEIEKELVVWIRNEIEKKTLFDNNNWKPFRDKYTITDMYLGYKRLFQFKHYFLQLAIDECADECEDCNYCLTDDIKTHFQLVLFGWKVNENDTFIEPYTNFPIMPDNIMPEKFWNMK